MKRILLVMSVAALMVAMLVVMAAPALARHGEPHNNIGAEDPGKQACISGRVDNEPPPCVNDEEEPRDSIIRVRR